MTNPIRLKALAALISIFALPTFVQAGQDNDFEEVSYEQLLDELDASQRSSMRTQKIQDDFDAVRLHAGIGLTNTFMNVISQDSTINEHSSGIQLSLGIDLFSPNWYSEGVFKNYGVSTKGTQELRLREFDLKVGYTNTLKSIWSYSLSTGLSNRFLEFSDKSKNINIDETTPSLIISTGIKAQLNKNLSLGAEISAHSAFVDTADRNSADIALRLTTSL